MLASHTTLIRLFTGTYFTKSQEAVFRFELKSSESESEIIKPLYDTAILQVLQDSNPHHTALEADILKPLN